MSIDIFDRDAPDFTLPATDGRTIALSDIVMDHGAVVAFICNHCPYVVSSARRMVEDARTLMGEGIGFVAICANDAERYPADSFDRMKEFAEQYKFPFPYLHDESQKVAAAYGAAVTPDFFGLDHRGRVKYRGRMDEGTTSAPPDGAERELLEAMRMVARTGEGPATQHKPAGCSIKWKP
ncbi:MAG: thioredoxin family protein [Pseudomonadota bacterium]